MAYYYCQFGVSHSSLANQRLALDCRFLSVWLSDKLKLCPSRLFLCLRVGRKSAKNTKVFWLAEEMSEMLRVNGAFRNLGFGLASGVFGKFTACFDKVGTVFKRKNRAFVVCESFLTSPHGFLSSEFTGKKKYNCAVNCRNSAKGSILLEAIIMVGLVTALTPVLYTHISDRKEEIANINKANTMLQLQREVENFLKDRDKRDSIADKAVISPSDLGGTVSSALDDRYKIGFKKSGDTISAIIVEREGSGNDLKAAKVAGLIGVSAGIKSAMNTGTAYGVNGLWNKELSDFGFNANEVPAGSTVVTTEYSQSKTKFYTSEMIVDSDLDLGDYQLTANKVVAKKVCIGGEDSEYCRDTWDSDVDSNFIMMKECYESNSVTSDYCQRAIARGIINYCSGISRTYAGVGLVAASGNYNLTRGSTSSWASLPCYFKSDGSVPTAAEITAACNNNSDVNRSYACSINSGGYCNYYSC